MLHFSDVTVFRGQRKVLDQVSGEVSAGQVVALVGENGAGKSTLLHTLCGALSYTGDIAFQNIPLPNWHEQQLAAQRAVLNQHLPVTFELAVPELVGMGRYAIDETRQQCQTSVEQYLTLMELQALAKRSVRQLSGGQLQRVHMARCLAQLNAFQPDCRGRLLLLDEPTSALDVQHQHRLLQITRAFADRGNAAIVAIHDLNLASLYADRVVLLNQGRVRKTGTTDEVLTARTLSQVYDTPMHVSQHPTLQKNMIFSEPQEISHEIRRLI